MRVVCLLIVLERGSGLASSSRQRSSVPTSTTTVEDDAPTSSGETMDYIPMDSVANNIVKLNKKRKPLLLPEEEEEEETAVAAAAALFVLDGTLPGGEQRFDPLKLASSKTLSYLREAETKHARLAMLGVLSYPLAELISGGRAAPSAEVLSAAVILVSSVELYGLYLSLLDAAGLSSKERIPGDLNFDPLGMLPVEKFGRIRMLSSELKHGRLAMLAVAGMLGAELAHHGAAIVTLTPGLFEPFWAHW
jgi:hypothetical protein